MDKFIISLLLCSAEMTAVSVLYILVLRQLKKRQSPILRYYAWVVLLLGFLMPVKPSFGRSAITINEPLQPAVYQVSEQTSSRAVHSPEINIWQIILVIWCIGALAYAVLAIIRYDAFLRGIRRLSKPADKRTKRIARSTAEQLGIKARVKVLRVRGIASPMMTGLINPTILLPERELSDSELALIIRHELTHFKHKDLWVRLLFMVCRAVHWFNPVMLMIGRSIDEECEHYCDYSVIKGESVTLKKQYCESILNAASAQSRVKNGTLRPIMTTSFFTPKQGLKHRLFLILSGRKRKYTLVCVLAAALTAVSGSVIVFASNEKTEIAKTPIITNQQEQKETTVSQPALTTTAKAVTSKADTTPVETYSEPAYAENEVQKTTTVTAPYYEGEEPVVTTAQAEWDYEYQAETTTVTYPYIPEDLAEEMTTTTAPA